MHLAINSAINGAMDNAQAKVYNLFLVCLMFSLTLMLNGCGAESPEGQTARRNIAEGRILIERTGCGSCHRIPGIASAQGQVGPPLDRLSRRVYLAGVLPNSIENLVLWIKQPQKVVPGSAMPDMGLSEAEAESIATYLYTLE